jgi:hypothetical protein
MKKKWSREVKDDPGSKDKEPVNSSLPHIRVNPKNKNE